MHKIPLEILYRLDEKITNLPDKGKLRRELVHEVAVRYQLSDSTVYRQLKKLQLHPNERAVRKDKGFPNAAGQGGRRPRPVVPGSLRALCFAAGKI